MVTSCVVYGCTNRSKKRTNVSENKLNDVTFHQLPKDEARRQLWVAAIRKHWESYNPKSHHCVCSVHFDKSSIHDDDTRRRRRVTGTPTIFDKKEKEKASVHIANSKTNSSSHGNISQRKRRGPDKPPILGDKPASVKKKEKPSQRLLVRIVAPRKTQPSGSKVTQSVTAVSSSKPPVTFSKTSVAVLSSSTSPVTTLSLPKTSVAGLSSLTTLSSSKTPVSFSERPVKKKYGTKDHSYSTYEEKQLELLKNELSTMRKRNRILQQKVRRYSQAKSKLQNIIAKLTEDVTCTTSMTADIEETDDGISDKSGLE